MWVIPRENFEGRAFIALIITFLVIATLFFALRLWARRIVKRRLDASDYVCFCGLVGSPMQR